MVQILVDLILLIQRQLHDMHAVVGQVELLIKALLSLVEGVHQHGHVRENQ